VHRARATFIPGASVVRWVLAIARHQLIDAHRCAPRETPVDIDGVPLSRSLSLFMGPSSNAEEIVVAKETAGYLRCAFTRLPAPQRAALELVRGQGLSLAEAAVRLGTTVTGVKLRAHRAFRTLRAELTRPGAAA
jgi:RNA polymerase sigma-70 factor (ECF subfamily)